MKSMTWHIMAASALLLTVSGNALAHDPVFGIGPHVLFKDGIEAAIEVHREKAGDESELGLELVYGITGDWAAGIEVPYAFKDEGAESSSGLSDINLFTKYRFWREDTLGLQESAAVMLAINGENGDEKADPPLGNGATDVIVGLTYGYEGLEKYRWASARYVLPGKNDAGFQKGNKWLVDFVVGWRPTPPEYTKPDTVWLLELNGEIADKAEFNGTSLANSGGTEWFISPGIFWTTRNFAIKSGIQIPIASDLNGTQDESDYRFKASFEWHL
ncbi:MAG: transporter [Gammaproteobacteria bacterium]|nr:transporter [Gammaproteobacteria bacterium]MCF6261404.1 transporter [Gammaproteobacteria bacterium]